MDILVKNVDIKLLKKQRDWVADAATSEEDDKLGIGLLELLDTMLINVEENKEKYYSVTRTISSVVHAENEHEAEDKFKYESARGLVYADTTTVEEN